MSVKTRNKLLGLLLRVFVSIILLSFLFTKIDFAEVKASILRTNLWFLVVGIVIYTFSQLINSYKWSLIANNSGFRNNYGEYTNYYYVGLFFNLFLPTTVGGDISKAYYLSKHDLCSRKAPAVYSVLAERYSGVVIIVWAGVLILFSPIANSVPFIFKASMSLLAMLIFIITPTFPAFWMQYFKHKKWVRTMLKDIRNYWRNPLLVFKALFWSVIYHAVIIGIHILISSAIGLKIPLAYLIMAYTMASMAGFLPLSFNGIGPREWGYIYFLSFAGVAGHDALIFSIMWFLITLSTGLFGAVFYIKSHLQPAPEEFDDDDDSCCHEEDFTEEDDYNKSSLLAETGTNKVENPC